MTRPTECRMCHTPIPVQTKGRPREYCTRACSLKAWKQRHPTPGRTAAEASVGVEPAGDRL